MVSLSGKKTRKMKKKKKRNGNKKTESVLFVSNVFCRFSLLIGFKHNFVPRMNVHPSALKTFILSFFPVTDEPHMLRSFFPLSQLFVCRMFFFFFLSIWSPRSRFYLFFLFHYYHRFVVVLLFYVSCDTIPNSIYFNDSIPLWRTASAAILKSFPCVILKNRIHILMNLSKFCTRWRNTVCSSVCSREKKKTKTFVKV